MFIFKQQKNTNHLSYLDSTDYCIQWPSLVPQKKTGLCSYSNRLSGPMPQSNSNKAELFTVVQRAPGQGMTILFNHWKIGM